MTKHWNRMPRDVVESPSLKTVKSRLDKFVGNWIKVALLEQGDCARGPPEVPSSLNHSVIL